MISIRERLAQLLKNVEPITVDDKSTIQQIQNHFPAFIKFVERKYGLKMEAEDRSLALTEFCMKYRLPEGETILGEFRSWATGPGVRQTSSEQAQKLILSGRRLRVLDVREDWEFEVAKLPLAKRLTPKVLDEMLTKWSRATPVLVYCHDGTRSTDAANFLVDRGFKEVYVLEGGIDAWSQKVEPEMARYEMLPLGRERLVDG